MSAKTSRVTRLLSSCALFLALVLVITPNNWTARADGAAQSLPFSQDWTNTGLITVNDDWSGVPGIIGYRGDGLAGTTGVNPQTILVDGTTTPVDVNINQTNPNTFTTGGVAEFHIANPVVALNGSGTARAPFILITVNATGKKNINVRFNARDIDGSADNSAQQIAVHYRLGTTGNFTNVPAGYIADASQAASATLVTPINVTLPANADNAPVLQIRIMTTDSAGNDEWIGIDDILIDGEDNSTDPTATGAAAPPTVVAGNSVLLTVSVTPGTPAAAINGVVGNLTAIGGSATQQFFDNGTNGDATIGDNVFSYYATVPVSTVEGAKTIPTTATDSAGRTASANIALTVQAPPPPEIAINQIQGAGLLSPWNGVRVNTTGIVTALKTNGFFIQSATPDADPNTSEGLFVFTGTGNVPPTAVTGNLISVIGTVQEFTPTGGRNAMTELSGSISTTLFSMGNALPPAVELTAADTNPNGNVDQLEKYEGMHVSAASLTVIAPTDGNKSEANATSTSNGEFWTVITGVARPFREAGIEAGLPLPVGAPANVPIWDGNPERLFVDSDALAGAPRIDVTTGAVITGLSGVLDVTDMGFTFAPYANANPTITGLRVATPVPAQTEDEFTIGSFNLERFYDDVNDPGGDTQLSATAYQNRLKKASLAIRNVLNTPDILGVIEVEKLSVLQTLAAKINADAVAAGQPNPNYSAYLEEGNDTGGIDVGFLVKSHRVDVINVTQFGKDTLFTDGNELNDRPPLVLNAKIKNKPGRTDFPVYVIVNHMRSLLSIEDPGSSGDRVRRKREAQAEFLASLIQSLQAGSPNGAVVSVGDYNAFEFNDGYADVMGVVRGAPAPADQVSVAGIDLVNPDLTALVDVQPAAEKYSYVFEGTAQTIDHVVVTQPMLARLTRYAVARVDADFPEAYRGDPNRPERISDHDAPVAYFSFPPPVADVAVAVSALTDPVSSGSTASFSVQVTNNGPDSAENVNVSFDVPAGSTFATLTSPSGWNCSTPQQGQAGVVSCSTNSLAKNAIANFVLNSTTACSLADGSSLSLVATATNSIGESDSSNNQAGAMALVTNAAPSINNLTVNKTEILAVNHKLTDVILGYSVSDNCGTPSVNVSVSSNQAVDGNGDGNTDVDWMVLTPKKVALRAERAGDGGDRIYTITVTATDSAGGTTSQSVNVVVPHDNGNN